MDHDCDTFASTNEITTILDPPSISVMWEKEVLQKSSLAFELENL
jgi:hypothetical protein